MIQLHSRGTLVHDRRTCLKDLHLHPLDLEAPCSPRPPRDITAFLCPLSDHAVRSHRRSLGRIALPFFHPFFSLRRLESTLVRTVTVVGGDRTKYTTSTRSRLYSIFLNANSTHAGPSLVCHEKNIANLVCQDSAKRPRPWTSRTLDPGLVNAIYYSTLRRRYYKLYMRLISWSKDTSFDDASMFEYKSRKCEQWARDLAILQQKYQTTVQ